MAHKHEIMGQGYTGPDYPAQNGMHVHQLPGGQVTPPAMDDPTHNHMLAELGLPVLIELPAEQMTPPGMPQLGMMPEQDAFPGMHPDRRRQMPYAADLHQVRNVEIFAAGTWNGDKYTEKDLDAMVQAYQENRETLRFPLKLGHNSEQKMLAEDGLPAAGYVENLRRVGSKLVADFVDIPRKIFELIDNRAYRKVSAEIFWNLTVNGKKYDRLLSAVALLGQDMPAVQNLSDILAMYGINYSDTAPHCSQAAEGVIVKLYELGSDEGLNMTEGKQETKQELSIAEIEAGIEKKYADRLAEMQREMEATSQLYAEAIGAQEDAEKSAKEYRAELESIKLERFCDELAADDLCTPAMRPYMRELLGEEKKEYSIASAEEGVEAKKFSKRELLREVLKLHAAAQGIDADAHTLHTEKRNTGAARIDEQEQKVELYMQKTGERSYAKAYKAVGIDTPAELSLAEIKALGE